MAKIDIENEAIATIIKSAIFFSDYAKSDYWLIIGTYRQGPGSRPEVSGITSPSLHSIPMKDLETCNIAGEKITHFYALISEDTVCHQEILQIMVLVTGIRIYVM